MGLEPYRSEKRGCSTVFGAWVDKSPQAAVSRFGSVTPSVAELQSKAKLAWKTTPSESEGVKKSPGRRNRPILQVFVPPGGAGVSACLFRSMAEIFHTSHGRGSESRLDTFSPYDIDLLMSLAAGACGTPAGLIAVRIRPPMI
jgi:hypothetical protein